MGRRKIEIKPIKDDRNRSVTFLKRKGGLFKKAHELSVLCQVDVAVVIFGSNKKLYHYSTNPFGETLQRASYFAGPFEHKGPEDYVKGAGDEDDDDDENEGLEGTPMPPDSIPQQLDPHARLSVPPQFQHVKRGPSASPPTRHVVIPYPNNGPPPTSQPGYPGRPLSRTEMPVININGPHMHQQGPVPNGYGYPQQGPPFQDPLPPRHPLANYQGGPYHPVHHPQPGLHPHQQHIMEQGRRSVPPQSTQSYQGGLEPPQHPASRIKHRTPSPPSQTRGISPQPVQAVQPIKPLSTKARSIFTPIDDSRSMLAQQWNISHSPESRPVHDLTIKQEFPPQPQPFDLNRMTTASAPPTSINTSIPPHRTFTQSSLSKMSQVGTPQSSDSKRPRLKVQIPSEHSDDAGSGTASSSHHNTTSNTASTSNTATNNPSMDEHSHRTLPPPSPSANTLLSAGATGPPNPFARPLPPNGSNAQAYTTNQAAPQTQPQQNFGMETPMSALPSRFMTDSGLLPSPSSFMPNWGFGREFGSGLGMGDTLPSPLAFMAQTPIERKPGTNQLVPGNTGAKRKTPDPEGDAEAGKKVKVA